MLLAHYHIMASPIPSLRFYAYLLGYLTLHAVWTAVLIRVHKSQTQACLTQGVFAFAVAAWQLGLAVVLSGTYALHFEVAASETSGPSDEREQRSSDSGSSNTE